MKKIINNRPIFYCFLFLWLGIYLSKPIFSLEIPTIIFVILTFATIAILCVKFKCIYRLALILGCFFIGVCMFFVSSATYTPKDLGDIEFLVQGRICVCTNYDSSQRIVLDGVKINNEKIGNVSVFVYNGTELEEGCIIKFSSQLEPCTAFTLGKYNSYTYKNNVKYSASVAFEDVEVIKTGVLTFAEALRQNVKYKLFENMGKEEAGISYASLFGDKAFLEDDIREDFSVSGMAHLLAVSGLHVGFVVAIISKLLFKANKKIKFGIMATLLFGYCCLCSFTASVVRASIMFLILEMAGLFKSKYDRLNAWSVAGIVCLVLCPFNAYDAGFMLSFVCVLCIFMFFAPVSEVLKKWRFPNWLASSLGVMLPVQLGIIPLIANFFGKTSLFSIFANLLAVPLFELFFTLLFVFIFIVVLIPPFGFILAVPNFIVGIIIKIAKFIASLDFAIINLTALTSLIIIAIYISLFVLSHFVNLKHKTKWIISIIVVAITTTLGIFSTYTILPQNSKIAVLNSYGESVYVLEQNGTSFAIGNFDKYSASLVEDYANTSRLYEIDYIICLNEYTPQNKQRVFKNVLNTQNLLKVQNGLINLNNTTLEVVEYNNNLCGIILNSNAKVFVCADVKLSQGQYMEFANIHNHFDLIIGNKEYTKGYLDYINYNHLLLDGNLVENSTSNGNKSYYGNWTFNLINNNICNMRGVD